jgi:hypothetical protein
LAVRLGDAVGQGVGEHLPPRGVEERDEFYAQTAPQHGISALTDQQVAGGMMLLLDLLVMLFYLGLVFYRSAQDHDRGERTAAVAG